MGWRVRGYWFWLSAVPFFKGGHGENVGGGEWGDQRLNLEKPMGVSLLQCSDALGIPPTSLEKGGYVMGL